MATDEEIRAAAIRAGTPADGSIEDVLEGFKKSGIYLSPDGLRNLPITGWTTTGRMTDE
jgi:hypothetical protein